jgi:RNA polymerase sigma-70 factor (ECF subfamily)
MCTAAQARIGRYVNIGQPLSTCERYELQASNKDWTKMTERTSHGSRFTHLVRPHFDALYGAARRLTSSPSDAEDLVQDVCLKAFESIDELEKIEFRRAWLLKVLYHLFVDRQRAKSRSPVDQADTGVDSFNPEDITRSGLRPDELLDRDARVETVVWAMGILDKDDCSLLALRDIEGYSLDELRDMTGLPTSTIKSRLHRTRSKLGRLLSSEAAQKPQLRIVGGNK